LRFVCFKAEAAAKSLVIHCQVITLQVTRAGRIEIAP